MLSEQVTNENTHWIPNGNRQYARQIHQLCSYTLCVVPKDTVDPPSPSSQEPSEHLRSVVPIPILIGPIPWGHSGPLCHALSLSSSSLSVVVVVDIDAQAACDSTGSDTRWMGVRRLAVANGPNIFQMLLVQLIGPYSVYQTTESIVARLYVCSISFDFFHWNTINGDISFSWFASKGDPYNLFARRHASLAFGAESQSAKMSQQLLQSIRHSALCRRQHALWKISAYLRTCIFCGEFSIV